MDVLLVEWKFDGSEILSTICTDRRPSVDFVNFLNGREAFSQLPSKFCVTQRPFVNFRQISVQQGELPLTFVNFLCGWETFHQLPSTFRAARRLSVNFSLLSVQRETFRPLLLAFHVATKLFVNFC